MNIKLQNLYCLHFDVSLNAIYGPLIPHMLSVRVHKAGMNALKAIVIVKLILSKQGLEFKLQSHRRVNTLH
jgi:hypothetical protein